MKSINITPFAPEQTEKPKIRKKVIFFDTTLRDGEQGPNAGMTSEEKLVLATKIARTGVDRMELGFPASGDDKATIKQIVAKFNQEGLETEVCGLARANKHDIDACVEALKEAKNPFIHTFISTSKIHIKEKLQKTHREVLQKISESISYAKAASKLSTGREWPVEWSAEDATRTNPRFLIYAVRAAIEAGADRINLPDTVGHGNSSKTGWMFKEVIKNCRDEIEKARLEGREIEFSCHNHNDRATAVAGSINALINGAIQVEGCLGNFGERAGNTNLIHLAEQIEANGNAISETEDFYHELNTKLLIPTHNMICRVLGQEIHPKDPVSGSDIAAHGAGIHMDGQEKAGAKAYNVVNQAKYGANDPENTTGPRSGDAHIINALRTFGVVGSKKFQSAEEKQIIHQLSESIKLSSGKTNGIFPAQVLFEYSNRYEGFSDLEFKIMPDGKLRVSFIHNNQLQIFFGDISEGNSEIAGLAQAISTFTGQSIDIIDQIERKKISLPEIEARYESETNGGAKLPEYVGAHSRAICQVTIANEKQKFSARTTGKNAQQATLEAIFQSAWPMIRQKIGGKSLGNSYFEELEHAANAVNQ
ncbi:hypothetical protein GF376_04145 [Candidatus Peregrinibacteria bacterium]|nr:hypothetical protein [Candidatus Peregrinibacteria bacterium]